MEFGHLGWPTYRFPIGIIRPCVLIERFIICPLFEVPFIGGSTVHLGESGLVYCGYINSEELVRKMTSLFRHLTGMLFYLSMTSSCS